HVAPPSPACGPMQCHPSITPPTAPAPHASIDTIMWTYSLEDRGSMPDTFTQEQCPQPAAARAGYAAFRTLRTAAGIVSAGHVVLATCGAGSIALTIVPGGP